MASVTVKGNMISFAEAARVAGFSHLGLQYRRSHDGGKFPQVVMVGKRAFIDCDAFAVWCKSNPKQDVNRGVRHESVRVQLDRLNETLAVLMQKVERLQVAA